MQTYDVDGTVTLQSVYHPLCTELYDAADLSPGPHQGTFASTCTDGHGRTIITTERAHSGGAIEARHILTSYLASGEPSVITRVRGDPTNTNPAERVVRWMRYDTLGRMVLNAEPHTSVNFRLLTGTEPEPDQDSMRAWRYVYNHAGDLVGTSDARGCGVDFAYDTAGRLLAEDYWPCEPHHPAHNAAPEVTYVFDARLAGSPAGSDCAAYDIGRPVATYDRASASFTAYDGRGRVVKSSTQIAKPDAPAAAPIAERYAPRVYEQFFSFDAADREVSATTGAQVGRLLVAGNSAVTTEYSQRGTVKKVYSSYGPLIAEIQRTADGLLTKVAYGHDEAPVATTQTSYDDRRRLRHVMTYRGPPAAWTSPSPTYLPAPAYSPDLSSASTFQLLLQDEELTYDVVGNPTEIRDYRIPEEWPDTAKPVTRKIQYDDLYRAKRIDYEYTSGSDTWESPFRAELDEAAASSGSEGGPRAADPRRALPSPHVAFDKRVQWQTWDYDWLGNNAKTGDDADGFYDRSLGTIQNDTASGKPYQLKHAALSTSRTPSRDGELATKYDAAGNLIRMNLLRAADASGVCLGGTCSQRFAYEWDEVGRLIRARRWDSPSTVLGDPAAELPDGTTADTRPKADLRYAYDAGDQRVLKTAVDADGDRSHTVYVFASLELRRADWKEQDGVFDYELTEWTEVPYLFAHGVRLGRVVWHETPSASGPGMPEMDDNIAAGQHVLLELGDHLGSTNVVLDLATGELVERSSFYAYGSTESDYRPGRWKGFREDYRFTGKEEDVEVGLQYFGKRYLNPLLGRWVSADPLTVHVLGGDANPYAYVSGLVLRATDPVGLCGDNNSGGTSSSCPSEGTDTQGGNDQEESPELARMNAEAQAMLDEEATQRFQGELAAERGRAQELRDIDTAKREGRSVAYAGPSNEKIRERVSSGLAVATTSTPFAPLTVSLYAGTGNRDAFEVSQSVAIAGTTVLAPYGARGIGSDRLQLQPPTPSIGWQHGSPTTSVPAQPTSAAKAGVIDIGEIVSNPRSLWGRSPQEIAQAFNDAGFKAAVRQSTRGSGNAQIVSVEGHPQIGQVQVHPGGGRHGGAYVKVSTSTDGILKVVDPSTYKPTPGEKATIIPRSGDGK